MRMLIAVFVGLAWLLPGAQATFAQTAAAAPAASSWTPIVRNMTRVESWQFFEPHPDGGDPDYTFLSNRLLTGIKHAGQHHELNASLQYVQFGGLPETAFGPGALGSGGNYFDHNRDTTSREVYVKSLNLLLRDPGRGLSARFGRMGYVSGSETPSGDAGVEALKRLRVDARLVGEFDWSLFQRAFDGVHGDWDSSTAHVTVGGLWPTQGGFEEEAGGNLKDVRVILGTVGVKPAAGVAHTEVQGFAYDYRDTRPVTGRPDNSGRTVSAVDIGFTTFGSFLAGAYPVGGGRTDLLVWGALQRGHWYESDQSAWSLIVEGGHQWTSAKWSPWLRAGWNRTSGDDDPGDNTHGTFMPPVPTSRKYAMSTAYTAMNLDDLFVHVILKPTGTTSWRTDWHRLTLSEDADLWYAGSGATRRSGSIFGYAGRSSSGSDDLGQVLETQLDVTLHKRWSVTGYLGRMWGGDVVRGLFADDRLLFFYFENVIQF